MACCRGASRGESQAHWILMDYLDVIVHVFTPETRDYYRLEQLWGEVPARAVGEGVREAPPRRAAFSMELRGSNPSASCVPRKRSPS